MTLGAQSMSHCPFFCVSVNRPVYDHWCSPSARSTVALKEATAVFPCWVTGPIAKNVLVASRSE